MHEVFAIINFFLQYGRNKDFQLTNLKLQKLAYFAQGLYLGSHNGEPLFRERIEAWPYGPLVPELYGRLRYYGREVVTNLIPCKDNIGEDSEQAAFLRDIADSFACRTAGDLVRMSHLPGSPWAQVWRGGAGIYNLIPLPLIQNYFQNLLRTES